MPSGRGDDVRCLLVSPSDPLTRRMRAGPAQRLRHPPPRVRYTVAADRVPIPASSGEYTFNPANVALTTLKFAVEHSLPLDQTGVHLVHSFFWDVRKFVRPWVHESDQSFGQFLSGYNNVGGLVKRRVTAGYASYLNSRGCVGIVTWSDWAKRGYEEDGLDPKKVFVVPPPFPAIHDRKRHEGCNVLFMGRDFRRKGGDVAIRGFSGVRSKGCRMLFVGRVSGEEEGRLLKSDPRIVHVDRPSGKDLREEIWPTVDVLVLPTRADAFAVTMVEAMRRGIPVVSTRLPPIAEVVEDGKSGVLTEPGDDHGVSEGLQRLVDDEAARRKMGEEAQRRAEALFSAESVGAKLARVYSRAWMGRDGR